MSTRASRPQLQVALASIQVQARMIAEIDAELVAARAEVARLTARVEDRDEWRASAAGYGSDMVEWKVRAEQAEATVARLRAALQFYADGKHFWLNAYHERRISDEGEHARAALAAGDGK